MRPTPVVAVVALSAAQVVQAQSLYERPVPSAPTRATPARTGGAGGSGGTDGAQPSTSAPSRAPQSNPGANDDDAPAPMQIPGSTGDDAAEPGPQESPRPSRARFERARKQPPQLAEISLFAIEPPTAREFGENDLVTIIISERSKTERNQKLDSKKEYDLDSKITAWIDLMQLLELRAVPDGKTEDRLPSVGAELESEFKGDGKYNREDKLTDRIQARIVEVKPNGTLLLEARRGIKTDEEGQDVVLSGLCRQEDVTDSNTVQSNQLYDLQLNVQNTGQVKKAGEKGLIPRVLDGLFNL
ncbi:MAG: flagellar basal body L-ring protein FlgH [Phycisphaerales bacterium]